MYTTNEIKMTLSKQEATRLKVIYDPESSISWEVVLISNYSEKSMPEIYSFTPYLVTNSNSCLTNSLLWPSPISVIAC